MVWASRWNEFGKVLNKLEHVRVNAKRSEFGEPACRVDIIVEPIFMPEGKRLLTSRCMSAAAGRPLIFAGVIRWPGTADTAIAQGGTDIIFLGRGLAADPLWPKKVQAGKVIPGREGRRPPFPR